MVQCTLTPACTLVLVLLPSAPWRKLSIHTSLLSVSSSHQANSLSQCPLSQGHCFGDYPACSTIAQDRPAKSGLLVTVSSSTFPLVLLTWPLLLPLRIQAATLPTILRTHCFFSRHLTIPVLILLTCLVWGNGLSPVSIAFQVYWEHAGCLTLCFIPGSQNSSRSQDTLPDGLPYHFFFTFFIGMCATVHHRKS